MHGIQAGLPEPLGATPVEGGVNFAVWAPDSDRVELCLLDENGAHWNIDLPGFTKGVYHGFVSDVGHGQRYGYRVHGQWNPEKGLRFNPAKLLVDPYAKAITGELKHHEAIFGHVGNDSTLFNSLDSSPYVPNSVVVVDSYDWEGDVQPHIPLSNTVIYEVHLASITKTHPDIPEHERGTYAGMAHPSVIAHIKNMGVTSVELLPIQHFVSETFLLHRGQENYWGYNTLGFFAPHAGYASGSTTGDQVREFRDMVKAYHRAGLEIILDVVYNHTPEGNEQGPTLSLRGFDNIAYYHLIAEDQAHYWDSTGCGNTVRASHPQTLRLIMDSLRYWVTEMHVDGFRFDLTSALTRNSSHEVDLEGAFLTAVTQDPVLRNVKLIAEPWDVGIGGYQVGSYPAPWSEWNDQFRDCVRDFWRGLSGGVSELGWRLTGSGDMYWDQVGGSHASVNFVTAHDGFTLRDVVTYNDKHNLDNGEENRDGTNNNRSWNCGVEGETKDVAINSHRQRQIRNMLATTILSAGIPMILAGDEMGRTQKGNNNAYCQNNEISWHDWFLEPWQNDLLAFTTHLIRIRQEHKVFQRSGYLKGENVDYVNVPDIAWFNGDASEFTPENWESSDTRAIGMYLAGAISDGINVDVVDNGFYFFLNSDSEPVTVTLPSGQYASSYRLMFNTEDEHDWEHHDHIEPGTTLELKPWSSALWMITAR